MVLVDFGDKRNTSETGRITITTGRRQGLMDDLMSGGIPALSALMHCPLGSGNLSLACGEVNKFCRSVRLPHVHVIRVFGVAAPGA
jgi:hypothetical protein